MRNKFITFSNLTLLVALSLSSVAAYYSIIGLTAIFAGAVIPIIIMGSILEVGKITTTVWLRKYWHRAGWVLKLYLVPAVVLLALLTSMGIFGFLSKAHMDSGVTSGDAQAKVAIYDEKIKTARDNIDANRKALKQLDEAVDQVMGRSTSEAGADKAVQIRRSQANDRKRLLAEIQEEQKTISKLSEERAPLASELRKVEAEVGPIKYIAALIYGDNADANMLEAAVRWVIILLVAVFDPLAIALVLAANQSKVWDKEPKKEPEYEADDGPIDQTVLEALRERAKESSLPNETVTKTELFPLAVTPEEEEAFKEMEPKVTIVKPTIEKQATVEVNPESTPVREEDFDIVVVPVETPIESVNIDIEVTEKKEPVLVSKPVEEIETVGVSVEPFKVDGNYIVYDSRHMHKDVFQTLNPELFKLKPDDNATGRTDFGIKFPEIAFSGDIFVRVDSLPNRVFKFNGKQWLELNREKTESYLFNERYIQHLVDKLSTGEYDPELLTEAEKESIGEFLKGQEK